MSVKPAISARRLSLAAGLALAAALAAQAVPAAAETRVKTGTLTCRVSGSVAIVVDRRTLSCTFRPIRGPRETYVGSLTKAGLNLGVTFRGLLGWGVFEPAGRHGSLAGTYVGATGEASLGAGIGANALIGGSGDSVALQPFSVQAQTGFNFALGGASLTLQRAR